MAIEDKQYLTLFDDIAKELEAIIFRFNERANGVLDKQELIALRREQNEILAEAVKRHRRAMDFMEGKPIQPETHFAEGVLIGVGGGATL